MYPQVHWHHLLMVSCDVFFCSMCLTTRLEMFLGAWLTWVGSLVTPMWCMVLCAMEPPLCSLRALPLTLVVVRVHILHVVAWGHLCSGVCRSLLEGYQQTQDQPILRYTACYLRTDETCFHGRSQFILTQDHCNRCSSARLAVLQFLLCGFFSWGTFEWTYSKLDISETWKQPMQIC
jgi:hypothetical protein